MKKFLLALALALSMSTTVYAGTVGSGPIRTGRANAGSLQGIDVCPTAPTDAQVLSYDLATTKWCPADATGGLASTDIDTFAELDTIVADEALCKLSGGTFTGQIVTDNLGIEFEESDTNPTCGADDYNIYADLSETALKACINGTPSSLDTTNITGTSADTFCVDTDGTDLCLNPDASDGWRIEDNAGVLTKVTMGELIVTSDGTVGQQFTLGGGDASTEPGYLALERGDDGGTTKWIVLFAGNNGELRAVADTDGTLTAPTDTTGYIIARLIYHATDCTAVTDGVEGDVCFEEDANTLYICETADGVCSEAGEWSSVGGGSSTVTVTQSMKLMSINVSNANAFVDTIDGTNFDWAGVRFVDAVTGTAYYTFKIPANLATTPAWNLILTSTANSAGGDVSLFIECLDEADSAVFDSALTDLFGVSGNPSEITLAATANDISINTISGTNFDATEAIGAGNFLVCAINRVAGDSLDTANVDWLLLDVSIRYDENS